MQPRSYFMSLLTDKRKIRAKRKRISHDSEDFLLMCVRTSRYEAFCACTAAHASLFFVRAVLVMYVVYLGCRAAP